MHSVKLFEKFYKILTPACYSSSDDGLKTENSNQYLSIKTDTYLIHFYNGFKRSFSCIVPTNKVEKIYCTQLLVWPNW